MCEALGLLILVTSLVRHRLWSARASVVVEHRLSWSTVCGILQDQGSNLHSLHWLVANCIILFIKKKSNLTCRDRKKIRFLEGERGEHGHKETFRSDG